MSRARTNKRGSLNYQINQRMREMDRIGESRYEAKRDYKENIENNTTGKTVGIHSYGTFGTYKSSIKQFTKWAKETEQGIKNIEDVKEEHIKDYIKYRSDEGYSSYTYSKDLSALNKVFGYDVLKKDCDVANRSYTEITNNREMKEHHNHINYSNYQREIDVVRATGMRRSNVTKITPNAFNYREDGTPYQVRLQDERDRGGDDWSEKGGRDRISDIVEQEQMRMKEIIDEHREQGKGDDEPLFEHIPDRLGTHRYRQEYAENTYKNYLEEYGYGTRTLEETGKEQYEGDTRTEFRGYDVGALYHTTKMLGHNRLDVVVYHYLGARD